MPRHDYVRYFPFSSIRPAQRKAIEFIIDAYESGKKYVLVELGTGVGKSAIGVTVARYMDIHGTKTFDDENIPLSGTYVLTTQKVLQQQYINDFGPGVGPNKNLMLSIKSANNYRCGFYPDQSCAESRRILTQLGKRVIGTDYHNHCRGGRCGYAIDKQAFIESPISTTNFSYFFAETTYGKKLTQRAMLVIDECHNTEQELSNFIEVTFSEKFAKEILKCKIPALNTQDAAFEWIAGAYKKSLAKYIKSVEKALLTKLDASNSGFGELSKQYEILDKHICKVNRFLGSYSPDNWVLNIVRPQEGKRGMRKFEFKPVDVSKFSNETLFRYGGRILMMSATVIDKDLFCQSVGLDNNEVSYMSTPSPFAIENRPIHYIPAGSMSMDNISKTLPSIAEAVTMLLEQHPNEKGIVHAVNYRIAQYLIDHVKTTRLLTHTSENRDEVLKQHIESSGATVLLSPSMMEGVDLADAASRFQILCKVPFPYLGDQVSVKRKEMRKNWYEMQTVKSIVQSVGRSVRNENDYAVTYILDSSFEYLYRKNRNMFPVDFQQSLNM